MRKLIESTVVSLDGVTDSPERWAILDDEATQLSMQELDNLDAFVMGRVTLERLHDNWSASDGNPYFDRIAAMPRFIASRRMPFHVISTRDRQPGVVLRAHYERVRTLLVIAVVVIAGLTYAVVALATTNTTTVFLRPTRAADYFDLNRGFAHCIAAAEPGARLDHLGRK